MHVPRVTRTLNCAIMPCHRHGTAQPVTSRAGGAAAQCEHMKKFCTHHHAAARRSADLAGQPHHRPASELVQFERKFAQPLVCEHAPAACSNSVPELSHVF